MPPMQVYVCEASTFHRLSYLSLRIPQILKQGVPGDCNRLAPTIVRPFPVLSCDMDLGRQVDVFADCDIITLTCKPCIVTSYNVVSVHCFE